LRVAAAFLAVLISLLRAKAAEAHLPEEKEALSILETVCPKQVRTEPLKAGKAYGCGGCPAFTGFAGEPPSKGAEPDFELRKVLEGSFTRPGASELLAEFFGCEPHVNNFGGTLLLEKAGTGWRRVRYLAGLVGIVRGCARKDGREILLDQGGYTGQGTSTGWVSTYDFFRKPDPAEHRLLVVEDTSLNFCELDRVTVDYISKLEFPDLNNDGLPDLRITVMYGHANVPARLHGHCEREFSPPAGVAPQIGFLFAGFGFHVAPGSARERRLVMSPEE
jgi:hypothetical protein